VVSALWLFQRAAQQSSAHAVALRGFSNDVDTGLILYAVRSFDIPM